MKMWEKTWKEKIFQQDNESKHTSKKAKVWFQEHHIPVMEWLSLSPDLNPIEHLWRQLKVKLADYDEPPKDLEVLCVRVQREWRRMPLENVRHLIESMPRWIHALLEAKGRYIKY